MDKLSVEGYKIISDFLVKLLKNKIRTPKSKENFTLCKKKSLLLCRDNLSKKQSSKLVYL